ncbi:hypothetical protein BJ875DRAFT_484557 [Amylocarpus encephaloides]|uniref:Uncharacterized protein n=1 Tax=Amylocarpus encephaloides TaxID=45428 RepID=A0A9P7YI65_9HELO|nr:hypothetical protein BJ875DRAFT_484557 [Amylocarpus encephaloides]
MAIVQELDPSVALTKEFHTNNGTTSAPIVTGKTVKKLYKHACAAKCCETRDSEHTNVKDEKNALTAKSASESIIHCHKLHHGDWVTVSFTQQGEDVKKIAAKALENYQDFDPDCEGWKFQPSYMPIVHRWDRLKEIQAKATEENGKQAADGLMNFLSPLLASSIDSLAKMKATKKISFSGIWQIFPPG